MQQIIDKVFVNVLKFDNEIVLKYEIHYPQIINDIGNIITRNFNFYNFNMAKLLKQKCETKLYKDAVELYKENKKLGYPIMVYEIVMKYCITYNSKNILSLYTDEYIFSGGAHGNSFRTSQTWNISNGKMIELYEFYKNNPYYVLNIIKCIFKQIEDNVTDYFEDYCKLIINTINFKNYFIKSNGVYLYFEQYDIAPYSTGIPVFKIQ